MKERRSSYRVSHRPGRAPREAVDELLWIARRVRLVELSPVFDLAQPRLALLLRLTLRDIACGRLHRRPLLSREPGRIGRVGDGLDDSPLDLRRVEVLRIHRTDLCGRSRLQRLAMGLEDRRPLNRPRTDGFFDRARGPPVGTEFD